MPKFIIKGSLATNVPSLIDKITCNVIRDMVGGTIAITDLAFLYVILSMLFIEINIFSPAHRTMCYNKPNQEQ